MQALRTLIDAPEFHTGLLAGMVALLVSAIVVAALRAAGSNRNGRHGHARPGLVGPAFVVAGLAGISGLGPLDPAVPTRVVFALAGLWLAGEIGARTAVPIGAVLALVAGIVLADPSAGSAIWITLILVLVPAIAGTTTADFDRRTARHGLGPVLMLVSIGGLYTTVPDTELALVVLGAAIPVTLLAWPRAWARLGAGGAYAAIGLYVWVATVEGAGRTGSIVGAVAVLALLVLEPIGRLVGPRVPVERLPPILTTARVTPYTLVVAQLLLVAWASRVAGLADDPITALVLALPALVLGLGVGIASTVESEESTARPRSPRDRRGRHDRRDARPRPRPSNIPAAFDHDDAPPPSDPSMN